MPALPFFYEEPMNSAPKKDAHKSALDKVIAVLKEMRAAEIEGLGESPYAVNKEEIIEMPKMEAAEEEHPSEPPPATDSEAKVRVMFPNAVKTRTVKC